MKKSVSIFLLTIILLQSCVSFNKTSVTINEASENGKVKVIANSGRKVIFDNILKEDGSYYGIYNFDRIPIDTTRTTSFYLKQPSYHYDKYYRIWVYLKDGEKSYPAKGYLYEVKDTSILISLSNPTKKKPDEESSIMEFQIDNIDEIKLRRIGNVTRGAMVGFAIGSIPIILTISSEPEDAALGLIISIPAAVIGGLLGLTKKRYYINGSIEQYSIYRHDLRDLAFIKQKEY